MKQRALIVVYILFVWFVISFVTNIIGPLMPIIIRDFALNLTLAGFLPFSFFLAYGIISIPAGSMTFSSKSSIQRSTTRTAWRSRASSGSCASRP